MAVLRVGVQTDFIIIVKKPELSGLWEQSQDAIPSISRPGFGLLSDSTHKTAQLQSSDPGWPREVRCCLCGTSGACRGGTALPFYSPYLPWHEHPTVPETGGFRGRWVPMPQQTPARRAYAAGLCLLSRPGVPFLHPTTTTTTTTMTSGSGSTSAVPSCARRCALSAVTEHPPPLRVQDMNQLRRLPGGRSRALGTE